MKTVLYIKHSNITVTITSNLRQPTERLELVGREEKQLILSSGLRIGRGKNREKGEIIRSNMSTHCFYFLSQRDSREDSLCLDITSLCLLKTSEAE